MASGVRVGVVGGGASGALAAIALGRKVAPHGVSVYEPRSELGYGYAYSTTCAEHVMNVPAGRLSVDPAVGEDFVWWAERRGVRVGSDDFVPRRLYGRYLDDRVDGHATHISTAVTDVRPARAGIEVVGADGSREVFDDVVLATGYGRRPGGRLFEAVESPLIVRDPYRADALTNLPASGRVLVIGTGLTAIDVILLLAAQRPGEPILAVSRRGRLPTVHNLSVSPIDTVPEGRTARSILREVRAAADDAAHLGGDWRSVIDGLRPHVPDIWRQLPVAERQRFLRLGRRHWDLARHRLAPSVAQRVEALLASGQLTVRRARPSAVNASPASLLVELGGDRRDVVEVAGAVVCTGVVEDGPPSDPVLVCLARAGWIATDPRGLGPVVDRDGRLLGPDGAATCGLWAIGPLRRASEWEATAIPEIRRQAWDLASSIASPLRD